MARSRSTPPVRRRSTSSNGLLQRLTKSTRLASYLRQLPAPALHRLIDEIGLEDSHEIVALLGPEQMRAVLSVALWRNDRPGQEETLDLDQLMRWVDLWMNDGERTLVQRVQEMDEDFLVTCLSKLVTVFDRTLVGVEDSGLELGNYLLFPRQEQHWHRLVAMLTTLWQHEPDFLLHALRRCAFERSILNDDIREHGDAESWYDDVAAARTSERQSIGYVNPTHASVFLMSAKTRELQELCESRAEDPLAAEYLRAPPTPKTTPPSDESLEAETSESERYEEFAALDALLHGAGVLQQAPEVVALLTDQRAAPPRSELLERALVALAQDSPELASQRLRELGFLANVLMSGSAIQGKIFSEKAAAAVALATANLGLDYWLAARGDRSADRQLTVQLLCDAPGVIRLFQIGYHLLCVLPPRCAVAVYSAKATVSRRGRVLLRELDELLGSSLLSDRIDEGAYSEAKAIIDGLATVMDSAACIALRRLIDPLPCFPRVLESTAGAEEVYVDKGYRHIATMADLKIIAQFLDALASYCG